MQARAEAAQVTYQKGLEIVAAQAPEQVQQAEQRAKKAEVIDCQGTMGVAGGGCLCTCDPYVNFFYLSSSVVATILLT